MERSCRGLRRHILRRYASEAAHKCHAEARRRTHHEYRKRATGRGSDVHRGVRRPRTDQLPRAPRPRRLCRHANVDDNSLSDAVDLDAVRQARDSLEAGVTTIRDLGGVGNAIALRDAIARGEHTGPNIVAANRALCMTGGHGGFVGRLTDGPWDARKAVREQYAAGAGCIKLIATGGVLTKGAVPGQDQLSEEEMLAAITEAHTHNLRVAAHAIGTNGIKNALRAGVDSIEHGHFVDDEGIGLFLEHGAYLVPTLAALTRICENAESGNLPEYVVRKATEIREHAAVNISKAWRAGVPIAGGSDAGTPFNHHGDYAYEVELMSTMLGMTPQQALTAATSIAARLLDVDAGTLAAGRPADLLLLDRDIGADIRALRTPALVIKAGHPIVRTRAASA